MIENFKRLKIRMTIDIREILKKMKTEELWIIIEYINSCKLVI